jgi:hypothetical protein
VQLRVQYKFIVILSVLSFNIVIFLA